MTQFDSDVCRSTYAYCGAIPYDTYQIHGSRNINNQDLVRIYTYKKQIPFIYNNIPGIYEVQWYVRLRPFLSPIVYWIILIRIAVRTYVSIWYLGMCCTCIPVLVCQYLYIYRKQKATFSNVVCVYVEEALRICTWGLNGCNTATGTVRMYEYCCKHRIWIHDILTDARSPAGERGAVWCCNVAQRGADNKLTRVRYGQYR